MSSRALTVNTGAGGVLAVGALIGLAFIGFELWSNRKAIANAFNPTSDSNLANQGASALVQQVSGGAAAGGEDSVGGALARFREWISGDDAKIRAMLRGSSTPSSSAALSASSAPAGEPLTPPESAASLSSYWGM